MDDDRYFYNEIMIDGFNITKTPLIFTLIMFFVI
jgi:hypothetical protein